MAQSNITVFEDARRFAETITNFLRRLSDCQEIFIQALAAENALATLATQKAELEVQVAALAATRLDLEEDLATLRADKETYVAGLVDEATAQIAEHRDQLAVAIEALEQERTLAQMTLDADTQHRLAEISDLTAEEARLAAQCAKHHKALGKIKQQVAALVDDGEGA